MTDYFVLLDQPRRAWLDPEVLKEIFHARTLRAHPDAQPSSDDGAFTQLNEAYQVLRDPKRRLQHLLALAGHLPSSSRRTVPRELEELFPLIADLTQEAEALLQQCASTTSALSRSLLKPQMIALTNRLEAGLQKLRGLEANSNARLRQIAESELAELEALYLEFSYLGKWITQLQERHLQLTSAS